MDENAYLVGHVSHLVGHASDFVELEVRFQARTELSWAALGNSLNQARETKGNTVTEKKKSLQVGTPKPVFMLEMASWIIIWVVLEPQVQELE